MSKISVLISLLVSAFISPAIAAPSLTEEALFQKVTAAVYAGENLQEWLTVAELECDAEAPCRHPHDVILEALDLASLERPDLGENISLALLNFQKVGDTSRQIGALVILQRLSSAATDEWSAELLKTVESEFISGLLSRRVLILATDPNTWPVGKRWAELRENISHADAKKALFNKAPRAANEISQNAVRDLIRLDPEIEKYRRGRYLNKPRIYMLCRSERQFPCLMVMRGRSGELVRQKSGELWNHPALALSKFGKSFNERNGSTPTGVFRIDGVMPKADDQEFFGKFRRLILNFVGSTPGEADHKFLLPPSSQNETWWNQAVIARDIGRGLFRIHGTGLPSPETEPYFPFVPTSGCVAQRENTYGKLEFFDQRVLLDSLMRASGLEPKFENETKIVALLYIVNLDSEKRPVTLEDVAAIGFE